MSNGMPYRTPISGCVRPGAWLLERDGRQTPLGDRLIDWDASTDLHLTRTIEVDVPRLRDETRLAEAPLAIGVVWWSDRHLRGRAAIERLDATQSGRAEPAFTLAGRDMGERLTLETRVILAGPGPADEPTTARHPGSVLWSHRHRVRLQGEDARFPMQIAAPTAFGFDPNAPWCVQIRAELESPTLGALHLLLNAENGAVCEAAAAPDSGPIAQAVMSTMRYDVGRILVDFALERDELWTREWPEDSLGASLTQLVHGLFPNQSREILLNSRRADPSGWAAQLAGKFALLAETPT